MPFDHVWPAWLWLLVNALAVYRITRLTTDDIISEPLRARVTRLGEPWASGVECPWCLVRQFLGRLRSRGGVLCVPAGVGTGSYSVRVLGSGGLGWRVMSRPFGARTDPIGL